MKNLFTSKHSSKKEPLFLNCGLRKNGMGNRITTICSGYAAAKINNRKPLLYWENSFGCRAEFKDIFKSIDGIEETTLKETEKSEDDWFTGWDYSVKRVRDFHLKWLDKGFTEDYWYLYRECARKIKLKDSLDAMLPKANSFSAIHIRSNWRPPSQKAVENLKEVNGKYLLCTDNKSLYDNLMGSSKDNYWSMSEPKSNHDYMNRDLEAQKLAAVDMFTLARANHILTLGGPSSFRNLAVLGYNVPAFKMNEGYAP